MKLLFKRFTHKQAHHFPPYHIGSSPEVARLRGDYRFYSFSDSADFRRSDIFCVCLKIAFRPKP